VQFSPDGRQLAAAGEGIKMWDGRTLTPELRVEQGAVALLRLYFGQGLKKDVVVGRVRGHKTISDDVRRWALALAESWPNSR
jgi:hypothetical protein